MIFTKATIEVSEIRDGKRYVRSRPKGYYTEVKGLRINLVKGYAMRDNEWAAMVGTNDVWYGHGKTRELAVESALAYIARRGRTIAEVAAEAKAEAALPLHSISEFEKGKGIGVFSSLGRR